MVALVVIRDDVIKPLLATKCRLKSGPIMLLFGTQ